MYTETWAPDFTPELPPRWHPATSPTTKVVYLDQWAFKHLVRDRAGHPENPWEAGCYGYFRQLALDGEVVFVLSQAHYQETWDSENLETRWDMAVVMAELTGFNTISSADLVAWDALVGVSSYLGLDAEIEDPVPFGWGHSYCLTGTEKIAGIIDTRTGRPIDESVLPEPARRVISEFKAAERLELATLALRDPRMEPETAPLARIPDHGVGASLVREEEDIVAALDKVERNESNIRLVVEGRCFTNETTFGSLVAAERALGLEVGVVTDQLTGGEDPIENRKALTQFLRSMPILSRYVELRVQSHQHENRKRLSSDAGDYFAIASVSPFVDHMVTDRKMSNLAVAAGVTTRSGRPLSHRLDDLRQQLEDDLALTA